MSFISYAQNFEDVMLWRALKHVEKGFYIDIGAQDPIIDSVSLAFYKHGWRGVHIEPTKQYSKKLEEARPDEIVKQVAIGNSKEQIELFEFQGTGLSTAVPEIAMRHKEEGHVSIDTLVDVMSLDTLLDQYSDKTIHWLKLDVEGFEEEAIQSWQNSSVRPWVLVIESTEPLTQKKSYKEWEGFLINKGYSFCYFDGLNRFYLHDDHAELLSAFSVPPNIFDDFFLSGTSSQPFYHLIEQKRNQAEKLLREAEIRAEEYNQKANTAITLTHEAEARTSQAEARTSQAEARASQAEARASQAEARTSQAEARASQAEARADQAEARATKAEERATQLETVLSAIHNSRIWRITAPWRRAGNKARWLKHAIYSWVKFVPGSRPRRVSEKILNTIRFEISKYPAFKNNIINILKHFPQFESRLYGFLLTRSQIGFDFNHFLNNENIDLYDISASARRFYIDLKKEIELIHKGKN